MTANAILSPDPDRTQLRTRACQLASEIDGQLHQRAGLTDGELHKLSMKLKLAELIANLATG